MQLNLKLTRLQLCHPVQAAVGQDQLAHSHSTTQLWIRLSRHSMRWNQWGYRNVRVHGRTVHD